jgi:hypothetical protein
LEQEGANTGSASTGSQDAGARVAQVEWEQSKGQAGAVGIEEWESSNAPCSLRKRATPLALRPLLYSHCGRHEDNVP